MSRGYSVSISSRVLAPLMKHSGIVNDIGGDVRTDGPHLDTVNEKGQINDRALTSDDAKLRTE